MRRAARVICPLSRMSHRDVSGMLTEFSNPLSPSSPASPTLANFHLLQFDTKLWIYFGNMHHDSFSRDSTWLDLLDSVSDGRNRRLETLPRASIVVIEIVCHRCSNSESKTASTTHELENSCRSPFSPSWIQEQALHICPSTSPS